MKYLKLMSDLNEYRGLDINRLGGLMREKDITRLAKCLLVAIYAKQ